MAKWVGKRTLALTSAGLNPRSRLSARSFHLASSGWLGPQVSLRRTRLHPRIAADRSYELKLDALIKLEVACQLALDSLPQLPPDTGERLRAPIQTLCDVTRIELDRLQPGSP